ncbi:DUF1349 domain-containing protein, partial [Klebsiella pneumoniae]
LLFPPGGAPGPLLRLASFPPGPVKAGFLCSPRGGGGLGVAFQDIQLPPPLDKALHDLS